MYILCAYAVLLLCQSGFLSTQYAQHKHSISTQIEALVQFCYYRIKDVC